MREIILILYYLIAVCSGVLTFGALHIHFYRNRSAVIADLLKIQGLIVLFFIVYFIWFYCASVMARGILVEYLTLVMHLFICAILFFLILFVNRTLVARHAREANAAFLLYFVAFGMVILYFQFSQSAFFLSLYNLVDILTFLPTFAYLGLTSFFAMKKGEKDEHRRIARAIYLTALGIVVPVILDSILLVRFDIAIAIPLFFMVWNIIFFRQCKKIPFETVSERSPIREEILDTAGITKREKDIVLRLVAGDTYEDIGDRECISIHTVKSHVHNAYAKLSVKNRYELIALLRDGAKKR